MSRPKIGQCIHVSWLDITTDHGWTRPSESLDVAACVTVGFVTAMGDASITLASCIGAAANAATEDEVNVRTSIPWGCITAWAPLRMSKAVKP